MEDDPKQLNNNNNNLQTLIYTFERLINRLDYRVSSAEDLVHEEVSSLSKQVSALNASVTQLREQINTLYNEDNRRHEQYRRDHAELERLTEKVDQGIGRTSIISGIIGAVIAGVLLAGINNMLFNNKIKNKDNSYIIHNERKEYATRLNSGIFIYTIIIPK